MLPESGGRLNVTKWITFSGTKLVLLLLSECQVDVSRSIDYRERFNRRLSSKPPTVRSVEVSFLRNGNLDHWLPDY